MASVWIPGHIGIHGKTVVDREAKNALDDPVYKNSKVFFFALLFSFIIIFNDCRQGNVDD
jgi:hypothetical protein